MSEKIIVGYDGTESAAEAVMWAANEAQVRQVPLRIVSCFDMPTLAGEAALGWAAGPAFDAIRDAAVANIDEIKARVSESFPALTLMTEVCPGPAGQSLLADADPGDLVVVGSSSRDGASAFWLGSTPRHLVHHSPCPVAVVRGSASRGRPDRVVVGVDGSTGSDQALRWAGDEADRHHVDLVVVHAWSYPYAPTGAGSIQARDLIQVDAACTLQRSVEAARERCGVPVHSVLLEVSPVSALLDTVRDGDLLVVGSRGRGALRSRLFGSTVNSVLDGSAVPVVVIRAESDSDEPPASVGRDAMASV